MEHSLCSFILHVKTELAIEKTDTQFKLSKNSCIMCITKLIALLSIRSCRTSSNSTFTQLLDCKSENHDVCNPCWQNIIFHIIYVIISVINDKTINQHKSVKYLGILIDCHLNWKEHIQQISKKISRGIGILCKIRHYVDVKILLQLYYAIILPFFSYCCIFWGNTYDHNIKLLERMQKKAIRLITFSDFDAHTSPLFSQLKLLKLQDHIKLQTLYFMHQFFHGKLPKIFDSFFIKTSDMHNVNTRFATRSTFYVPKIRTNYGKFNIRYNGPILWNETDERFKILTPYSFKRELSMHFINFY